MTRVEQQRLKWKCRRGLLELDLVLEKYLRKHPPDSELAALLDLPDHHLWDIVAGRSDDYPARCGGVVARLRTA